MTRIRRPAGEAGLVLLEVLIAAVVAGISVVGVALLLSSGHTLIVAQGDDRVALFLAVQGIEQQIAAGFPDLEPNPSETTETLAGLNGTQAFERLTCMNFVNDDDPTSPPGCSHCAPGGSCTRKTARVTVTVTPTMAQSQPVTLQTVVVKKQ